MASKSRTPAPAPPRERSALKIVLNLLRWGLCIAAVVFLYNAVSWHDTIRIDGPQGPLVRLVSMEGDEGPFVIERDGTRETVTRDRVHYVGELPDVHYGIAGVVRELDYGWAWLSLALFAPVPIMAALRLVWMLKMQNVRLGLWDSIKLTYAGNFFNFALPGSTGGDLIKAYYLTRHTHRKTEAVTTVFLDRVIGLIGLVLVAGIVLIFAWKSGEFEQLGRGLMVVVIAIAVGAAFVLSKRLRHMIGLPALAAKLPAGEHLLRIGRTLTAMREHLGLTTACLILTIILQALVMVSVFVFAQALQMHGDYIHYLIYLPMLFLVAALPIAPPQGFGVMEVFAVQFFSARLGNSIAQAFALALAIRLIQLVWALPGVLVPLLGAHLPKAGELEALEHVDASDQPPDDRPQPGPVSARVAPLSE
jgi:uncharacterized protein (TIRG00374 family)